MKLLIVEDEPKTGQYLQQGLSEAGFIVDLASDGLSGEQLALHNDYDLLVLDVMLPGRTAGSSWPICVRPACACRCCFSPPETAWKTACMAWSWAPTIT